MALVAISSMHILTIVMHIFGVILTYTSQKRKKKEITTKYNTSIIPLIIRELSHLFENIFANYTKHDQYFQY